MQDNEACSILESMAQDRVSCTPPDATAPPRSGLMACIWLEALRTAPASAVDRAVRELHQEQVEHEGQERAAMALCSMLGEGAGVTAGGM